MYGLVVRLACFLFIGIAIMKWLNALLCFLKLRHWNIYVYIAQNACFYDILARQYSEGNKIFRLSGFYIFNWKWVFWGGLGDHLSFFLPNGLCLRAHTHAYVYWQKIIFNCWKIFLRVETLQVKMQSFVCFTRCDSVYFTCWLPSILGWGSA